MSKDIRKKILDATLKVIAKEKISGTRMHLIAKEAGMTQSNLHYYFPTKNDLLIALLNVIQEWFSEKRIGVIDLENKSFNENLHGFFEEKIDTIINNKNLEYVQLDYWVQGTVNPEIRSNFRKTFDIWRNNIEEVFNRGDFSQSHEKVNSMIPYLMVSLMMGASLQYSIDEGSFNLDEYFEVAEKMILKLLDK